ncbi:MAG: hypothetical protein JW891_09140 [Candidatus Lokiarchaeota archaeon]|nr:hypothetical protein [Candidatus Lokiarchaeota archaeon]
MKTNKYKKIPSSEAKSLIIEETTLKGFEVDEFLDLRKTNIKRLPEDLKARRIDASDCENLKTLPQGLECYELILHNCPLEEIHSDITVKFKLDLSNCSQLKSLPENLSVGSLVLRNCGSLKKLPEGLTVNFLDVSNCTFSEWPENINVEFGNFIARDCENITTLPASLNNITQLDVSNCVMLSSIPEGVKASAWIDLARTRITGLPNSLKKANLRWRGVPITHRIAFQPETITSEEILKEENVELRRVMIEKMGYHTFIKEANAKLIHEDTDPGGPRMLYKIDLKEDEPLVCLSVNCPSTGRNYIIRVPPDMKSCHQAAAWIAGYDDPKKYKPKIET